MDRELNPDILIDYHFGTLDDADRKAVEEALLASEDALRSYLRLKRTLDGAGASQGAAGAEDLADDRPSPGARDRLRAAVAAEVAGVGRGRRAPVRAGLVAVLARPVPLYQTLAVAAAVALASAGVMRRPPVEPAKPVPSAAADPGATVDLARPSPLGLDVF